MDNKSILKEQITNFKRKYPLTIGWRLEKNSRVILEHLHDDEVMKYACYAQKNKSSFNIFGTCIVAITNKRLIIGRDRVVIGYFFDTITPDMFNDLKIRTGIIFGRVIIDTVKELVILSNISKSALAEIEEEITSGMIELKDNVVCN